MTWIQEFGAVSGAGASLAIPVPAGGVPVGHTLILGVTIRDATSVDSITDTQGNTWTLHIGDAVGATTTRAALASCSVTNALGSGDTITVTDSGGSAQRWAASVQEFDDVITSIDDSQTFDNGGNSSASLSAGTVATDDTSALVMCVYALVNSGRVFTPGSGYTAGTKQISTGGSGERAVVMQWRYVTGPGSFTTEATLNSSGTWTGVSTAFGLDAPASSVITGPDEVGVYHSTANVTTSGAVAVAGTAEVGDVIVLTAHAGSATAAPFGVSDSKGNNWTLVDTETNTGTAATTGMYVCVVTNPIQFGDTITVTRTGSGSLVWTADAYSGVDTTDVIVDSDTASSNSATTPYAGPSMDVVEGSMTVSALTFGASNPTITPGNGYAVHRRSASTGGSDPREYAVAYKAETADGTTTPSFSTSSASTFSMVSVVLRPSSGDTNLPPNADAGEDQIVRTGAVVNLDGSGSADVDGTIAAYDWIQLSGTTVTLSGANTATPSFVAPSSPATLVFRLTVTDNEDAVGIDEVTIKVLASPTLAIIGDSLTERDDADSSGSREDETRALLTAEGWSDSSVYWYGRDGKRMLVADSLGNTTIQNIDAAVAALGTIDQMVIGLGTNDVVLSETDFEDAINAILDHCESVGVGELYWVGLTFVDPENTDTATFNPILQDAVEARSWATYLDWNTAVHDPHDDADWIYPTDSTHMTTQGYLRRDQFIINALVGAPYYPAWVIVGGTKRQTTSVSVIIDEEKKPISGIYVIQGGEKISVDTPSPDLIAAIEYPLFVSHRGGAGTHPQNTLAAFTAYQTGWPVAWEMDLHGLSDGTWALNHDPDVVFNGSTTLLSTLTPEQWATVEVAWPPGFSGPTTYAATFDEMLAVAEPDRMFIIEPKGVETVQPLIDLLTSDWSLRRRTIVTTFFWDRALAFQAAGVHTMYMNNAPNMAAIAAEGIEFVGVDQNAPLTQTHINDAHAAGLKIAGYTINNATTGNNWISNGLDILITNFPARYLTPE